MLCFEPPGATVNRKTGWNGVIAEPNSALNRPVDCAIERVEPGAGRLVIGWRDGGESAYRYIWLRDNCACPACGDRVSPSGERFLKLTDIPVDVAPAETALDDDGALLVTWNIGGHASRYEPAWLRNFGRVADPAKDNPVLWDGGLNDALPEVRYADVGAGDEGLLALLERVRDYAFAVIRDVPPGPDSVERLAGLLGFIRETSYGRVFEIRTVAENRTLAETRHAIAPHSDELFRDAPPGVIVFHCLEASADGGGATVLVDGFNAAARLRETDPAAFDFLVRVPLPYHRRIGEASEFRADTPMIALDAAGNVTAFRCNERTMAPVDLPEDLVGPVYAALRTVLELVYGSALKVEFQLRSGEAVVFDNQRVLHARTAFGGRRHIRQCHVDRDEVFSRLRRLSRDRRS